MFAAVYAGSLGEITSGEVLTLALMAIALGMDAFSVSLGIGMRNVSRKFIAQISLCNGLFHMMMPLLGIAAGHYLSQIIEEVAIDVGGILLLFFGAHMLYSSLSSKAHSVWFISSFVGMMLFSFSVSLDSFSVGLSLGLFEVNVWLTIILFGLAGLVMTALGLLLGQLTEEWLGSYGEIVGGLILIIFGLQFLL